MNPEEQFDVLGITSDCGGFHDSSVAWIRDGRIMFALSEERISRIKHDYSFPEKALAETLRYSGLRPSQFQAIAVGWKSYNPFSGFFSRNIFDVPRTALRSLSAHPASTMRYITTNILRKKIIGNSNHLLNCGFRREQVHYISHHLAHASSSYRTSGFRSALSVNFDCFGPDDRGNLWSGASYLCEGDEIRLLDYVPTFASVGLFYSAVSICLGFKFGDGEGKTMGLAAYGDSAKAIDQIRAICPRFEAGQWKGHASWSDFRLLDNPQMLFSTKWGHYLRNLIASTSREDVACATQLVLEKELMAYMDFQLKRTGARRIVLAGGTFLNVSFNRKLAERADVDEVFVHPYPSDGGTAVGSALELSARISQRTTNNHRLRSAALGPEFCRNEILNTITAYGIRVTYVESSDLAAVVATFISEGNIVGWFQGRAEWGPRALGNRSVLADPRAAGVKDRLNRFLKSRDWFMPFAPSLLEEYAPEYLENYFYSPFMTFSFRVKPDKLRLVPEIMHRDGTARPNIVREVDNPLYHKMITHFHEYTGVPLVLNTSFNRHGLPLVHTPANAIDHLLWGCVDLLAIGNFVVRRGSKIEPVDDFSKDALDNAYSDVAARHRAISRDE